MRHKMNVMTGLAVMLLLASTACSSGGDYGDIFGGGSNTQSNLIRGTVEYVDSGNRSIVLRNVNDYGSMLSSGGGTGNTVRVYYDNQTEVQYQGQDYRPTDLEPGDEVEVRVNESGSQLIADTVTVTRNVSAGGSTYPGGSSMSMLRGTVRYIDTNRRTIELDRGFGTTSVIEYDNSVNVAWGGRTYMVTDLERGDEIEIRVSDLGGNRFRANDITVLRSVSGTSGSTSSSMMNIRGTVRYVDTARRTIELDQVSGISGFNTGAGTIVISYGSNASIEVGGQMHPVSGLERGDVIEVQADRSGSTYFANRIFLVRNVRD